MWDTLIKKNPINWFMIPLISLLFLPMGLMELRWTVFENKLSSVVNEVSGTKGGTVHCQRFSEAFFDTKVSELGHVNQDKPKVAVVNYQQCQQIFSWLESGKGNPTLDQVHALHVLTHEAVHVSGQYNEAVTECTAINRDHITVRELGGSEETGHKVASSYYSSIWPDMEKEYKLEGCQISPEFDSIAIMQELQKKAQK